MKQLIILLTLNFFVGCQSSKEIKYYPSEEKFKKEILIPINDKSFNEIIEDYKSYNHAVRDTTYFYNLELKENIKKIVLYPKSINLVRGRNILRIDENNIHAGYYKSFKVDELSTILKKFYLNKGQEDWFSTSHQKAIIVIESSVYKKENGLEIILKKLTKDFDLLKEETKEDLELYIILATPLPPPPPPSGGVKKDN